MTPTLEARLAELLPQCTWAMDCASFAQKTGRTGITPCRPCRDRAAILALIREREREERERCANEPFAALRRDALDPNVSMDKMKRWNSLSPGALWMRDAIHALEDRP